ncbi:Putative disease resistance RPP13-like protein [Arachis hypogaea]|nr:Putative disease resistance RPP13-like protein [Arachis hypogaea]
MLPSRMEDLVNMRHLDIRGTSRLKEMPKGMSKLKYLNFLSDYIIGKHEENGIRELGTLDNLHGSFCISKLENVKNSGEVLEAKMGNKKHINTLELNWLPDGDIDDVQTERDILGKLQPHQNLKELSIVMAAPHLEELHQYDCPKIDCFADEGLPPSLKNFNSLSATNSRVG